MAICCSIVVNVNVVPAALPVAFIAVCFVLMISPVFLKYFEMSELPPQPSSLPTLSAVGSTTAFAFDAVFCL